MNVAPDHPDHPLAPPMVRTQARLWLRLTTLMVVLFLIGLASPAMADDWYAAPNGGGSDCTQAAPCTIQGAIDKAGAGDTVHVAEGQYEWDGTIQIAGAAKNGLTLIGDNSPFAAGSAPADVLPAADASELLPATTSGLRTGMIWVRGAQDVTIENLLLQVDHGRSNEGIVTTGNANGLVLRNNFLQINERSSGQRNAISLNMHGSGGTASDRNSTGESGSGNMWATLEGNVVFPIRNPGNAQNAISTRAVVGDNVAGVFRNNQLAGYSQDIRLRNMGTTARGNGIDFEGNYIFGAGFWLMTPNDKTSQIVIRDNHFIAPGTPGWADLPLGASALADPDFSSLKLVGSSNPVLVEANEFAGYARFYRGLWIQNWPNVTIKGNDFTPNPSYNGISSAILVGNKEVWNGAPVPHPLAVTILGNTFNAGHASGNSRAIVFVNDNDASGTATAGSLLVGDGTHAGANHFAAGLKWYVGLDEHTCNYGGIISKALNCSDSSPLFGPPGATPKNSPLGEGINYTAGSNGNTQGRPFRFDVTAIGNAYAGKHADAMTAAEFAAVAGKMFDQNYGNRTALGLIDYGSGPRDTVGTVVFDPALPATVPLTGSAYTVTASLVEEPTATCVVSFDPTNPTAVGIYDVTADCSGVTHHVTATSTLTIEALAGTVALEETGFDYDGTDHVLQPKLIEEPGASCTATPASVHDAGSYNVDVSCTGSTHSGSGTVTVTVNQAAGSVAWGTLDFDYSNTAHAVTAQHSGTLAACTVTPASVGPEVGAWTVSASCNGDANHEGASATATATVGGSKVVHRIKDNAYFASIQAAIDDHDTLDGDELEVAPGVYSGGIVITKSVHLRGSSAYTPLAAGTTVPPTTVLDNGGAPGIGITVLAGVQNVVISRFEVRNFGGECFYSASGNHGLEVSDNYMHHCGGAGAIYVNGNGNTQDVLIANNETHDAPRGIIVWNGPKLDFTIRDNLLRGPNLPSGIIFNDGTASGVEITGNRIENTRDTGIALLQLTSGSPSGRANVIADNEIVNPGRYGLALHMPNGTGAESGDGAILVENNLVKGTSDDEGTFPTGLGGSSLADSDRAGISVVRRFYLGPSQGHVDATQGVIVRDNHVVDFDTAVSANHEAYGLVIEGLLHRVEGNHFENNQIAYQVQQGHQPGSLPGNSDLSQINDWFDRGNAPASCVATGDNTFDANDVDRRSVPETDHLLGGVYNETQDTWHCTIAAAIGAANAGNTLKVFSGTYAENVVVNKTLTLNGPFAGTHGNAGSRGGPAEAVIHPASGIAVRFSATASTLDGFTVGSDGGDAVRRNAGTAASDLHLVNNRFENVTNGSGFFSEPGASGSSDGLVIARNRFAAISGSGASAGRGVVLFKGTSEAVVEDNDFIGIPVHAVHLNGGTGLLANVTVSDNRISGTGSNAMIITNTNGVTVTGNTVAGVPNALYFSDKTSDFTVTCNTFSSSGAAIGTGNFFGNTPNSNVRIFHNSVSSGGANVSNGMPQDLIVGSNWYGGSAPTKAGANLYVADALPTDPIGDTNCGDNTPVEIVTYGGTGTQSAAVDTAFTDLRARVQDVLGGAVVGEAVSFSDPSSTTVAGATLVVLGSTTNYNGEATATATANSVAGGPYSVTAESDSLVTSPTFLLTNTLGTAAVTITDTVPTYDGDPKSVSVSTAPSGLGGYVELVYKQGVTTVATCAPAAVGCGPTQAGTYDVTGTIIGNLNYGGSGTGTLTINRASTTIDFAPLSFVYTGSTFAVTALLHDEPATSCVVTGTVGPDVGGSPYAVTSGACVGTNYESTGGTANAVVTPQPTTISFTHLAQEYDGSPKSVVTTTSPTPGVPLTITYDGSPTPPTAKGTYTVAAATNDANYSGSGTATMKIVESLGDIALVMTGPIDPIYVGDKAQYAATMLANPALHAGEYYGYDVVLSKSGGDPLALSDLATMEVYYQGAWVDATSAFGSIPFSFDAFGNLVYEFPAGLGYDATNGFPILDPSWTWFVRFSFATPGTYTVSTTLTDGIGGTAVTPTVAASVATVVEDALPLGDIRLAMSGPLESVEVGEVVDYTATMTANPALHVGEEFDVRVTIAKTGGTHALAAADLASMEAYYQGNWEPIPANAFQLVGGELVLDFPSDLVNFGFEIQDPEWMWFFRASWADTGTYTMTAQVIPHADAGNPAPLVLATAAFPTDVVEATPHLPNLALLLNGPLDEVELGDTAEYTGLLLAEPAQFAGQDFWVRIRISKTGGDHALAPTDLAKMELYQGGWQDFTGVLQPLLQTDGSDLVYYFPQPNGAFPIENAMFAWNFRFTYGDTGEYTATADLIDAADPTPLTAPSLANASVTTTVIQTPDIQLNVQGAVTGTVGVPVEYLGTLTADPLPDASDLFYIEVRVRRDGAAADEADVSSMEIFWNSNWVDPVRDLGLTMPWTVDPITDELVYLFPQPLMTGFLIDEPSSAWNFRFTYANDGIYTARSTVVTADGNATPVSNSAMIFTVVDQPEPEINLHLQGAITGMVGTPVQYVGTLTADPLPDASERFYVEVRVQRDGVAADAADIEKAEIFWGGGWVDPEEYTGDPIPWSVDLVTNELVYLFPEPLMAGFLIDEPTWSWQFRFTYANAGEYTATATVVTADASLTPVSNVASIYTNVDPLVEDVRITLNGPVAGVEVESPTAYLGRLQNLGGDLPEDGYVQVRIEMTGVTLAASDVTLEVFNPFISDWEEGFPTEANGGLEVDFPDDTGFAIPAGFDYTHQFRITYHLTGVFHATATVIGATSGVDYASAEMFTEVIAQSIRTATVEFDPLTLHATYDGNPHAAVATTDPAGLALIYAYDGVVAAAPTNAGSYVVQATVSDALYQGSATAVLVIDRAPGTVDFSTPLSAPFGSHHSVTATIHESGESCVVTGVPTQSTPAGNYTVTAVCDGANYTANDTVTYTVTASAASIEAVLAAPVGVVTLDPQPTADAKKSYFDWRTNGSAGEYVRALFKVSSNNPAAVAGDLVVEYLDTSDSTWKNLPLSFAGGEWSGWFGPGSGFPLVDNAVSSFRATFQRGGRYVTTASLVGVDSSLILATSTSVATDVAHLSLSGLANEAGRVGEPVESAMTLTNTGTAALSSGMIPVVPAQPAPNDENVRGHFTLHWDGGALAPATASSCGTDACASPDVHVEFYDETIHDYRPIYNLRQAADGQGLYGYFGALSNHGVPVPAGHTGTYLFRVTYKQHTGNYTLVPQVVGIDSDTVYAEATAQQVGIDTGVAAKIEIVGGDAGVATVGGHAYDQGDLVVRVLDAADNPVAGAQVAFNVLTGANGAGANLSAPVATNAAGETFVTALSNDLAGAFEVTAKLSNGVELAVPFGLLNEADTDPAQVQITIVSGNGQTAEVDSDYALPLLAKVTDRFGNPLAGIDVDFSAFDPGAGLSPNLFPATSGLDGLADSGTIHANVTAGTFTVTALVALSQCDDTAPNVATCAVDFSLTNTAAGAASVTLASSDADATVGTMGAYTLTASVVDDNGNPVEGVSVTLVGPSSGAGITPALHVAPTDAAGQISHTFDANTIAGAFTVQAVVSGTSGASVGLENTPDAAVSIERVSGDGQAVPVGSAFADLVVRVIDQYGNTVADDAAADVDFSAPTTGASADLAAATATSGTDGLASMAATANATAGSYNVIASFGGTSLTFALKNTVGGVAISDIVWVNGGATSVDYDGSSQAATATVTGSSLVPSFTYNGSNTAPTNAGSYQVIATIDDGNVYGTASAMLTIAPAPADTANITLTGGTFTYDGGAHPATVDNPIGVAYTLSYNPGGANPPVNVGSYAVTLTVTDPNYASETWAETIEIEAAEVELTFGSLSHVYDGDVKSATVVTNPAGVAGVSLVYEQNGTTATPQDAGDYDVLASLSNPNYVLVGPTTDVLSIAKATATVTISDTVHGYDGSPKPVTVTTDPTGLNVDVTYDADATVPSAVGEYAVVATIDEANYTGQATATLRITSASVVISDIVWVDTDTTSVEYDGSAKAAKATVAGSALTPSFTYNGSSTEPTEAGSYFVVATVNDGNIQGTASATLVITPMAAGNTGITLTGGTYVYNDLPHPATVDNPNGVVYTLTYAPGGTNEPVTAGTYLVVLTVTDPNYAAETLTATITILNYTGNCMIFCDDFEDGANPRAQALAVPGDASVAGAVSGWQVPATRFGQIEVVIELTAASGQTLAWLDTANVTDGQWLRLRWADASGTEHTGAWVQWNRTDHLAYTWDLTTDGLVLRFGSNDQFPASLMLELPPGSPIPEAAMAYKAISVD